MGKLAFVFAGQGAQKPGMGLDVAESVEEAKEIFARAERIRKGTAAQCFRAEQSELSETRNTQPCVYTVDMEMAAALDSRGIRADMVAGYSLGELAALAYANAFSFEDGLGIVSERGKIMQSAADAVDSGMVAVLKLDDDVVEELCGRFEKVFPVNFNCRGQITVAGDKEELDEFVPLVKEAGGLTRILEVSGGFHSPFMAEAADNFSKVLGDMNIAKPEIPVYSNRTSMPYEDGGDRAKALLTEQIANPIRWQNLIENMISEGVDTFVEVGVGTALTKMITRISKDVRMLNVCDVASLEKTVEILLFENERNRYELRKLNSWRVGNSGR